MKMWQEKLSDCSCLFWRCLNLRIVFSLGKQNLALARFMDVLVVMLLFFHLLELTISRVESVSNDGCEGGILDAFGRAFVDHNLSVFRNHDVDTHTIGKTTPRMVVHFLNG